MEIEAMRMFLRLSESLHFGRTSQEFHLSPSAFSRAIQRIEEELGQSLLIRDKRKVLLTPEGEAFRDYCYQNVLEWDAFLARKNAGSGQLRGELRLFCTVTACNSILPFLLNRFRGTHPGIHLKLKIGNAYDAIIELESGTVDASVGIMPEDLPPNIQHQVIATTPLVMIAPTLPCPISELMKSTEVDWNQVPVVLPERGIVKAHALRWFEAKQAQPNVYTQTVGNEEIPALVSLGCGVGVVPQLLLELNALASRIQVLRVSPALPEMQAAVFMPKQPNSPILRAFWRAVVE